MSNDDGRGMNRDTEGPRSGGDRSGVDDADRAPPEDVEGTDTASDADESRTDDSDESPADPTVDEAGGGGPNQADEGGGAVSGRLAVLVSALVALAITALSYWVVQGFSLFYEEFPRVQPTIENRGVGADWIQGNTDPALDALIALVHAADVILGVFILVMVFLHWAAFRRLATKMRRPDEGRPPEAVAADGGAAGERANDDPACQRADDGSARSGGGEQS